jgi:membrane glycosyltransferase
MQYLALLRLPGLTPMARWQLIQAILLFLSAPFYVAILLLAAWNGLGGGGDTTPIGALLALLIAGWYCHYGKISCRTCCVAASSGQRKL